MSHREMEKVYVNPDHSSQLLAQISILWKRDKYCDAALNLGSTRYKLHKLVLVAVCPDIMRLLLHTEENNVFDFYVPSEHDRSAVENVLKYLYEGVIQLTQANVNGIEKFSQTLQLQSLIRYCIHYKTSLKNGCQPDNDEQVFRASDSMQMSNDSPPQGCANNINMISSGNLTVPHQAIQKTIETRNPFGVLGAPDIMKDVLNCPLNNLLNTVPVSFKSETDTSDIEIFEDTQTNLIRSATVGEKEKISNGAADFHEMLSSNNGQLNRNTDIVRKDFTPYSSSNLISTQGDFITYSSADHLIKQDESTPSSSYQHKPAHGATGFMEVLPVDSILKQFSDKNSEFVIVLAGNDSVKDKLSQQTSQNSDQSSLDKTAVYFSETDSENITRCKDEERTSSSTFIMVCESLSTNVKDKAKPESNLPASHHTDPFLEAPPSYQGSDLHHGMQVGSRTYTQSYTENSRRSDISIQNNTKNNSMSTHFVQCSLDDSEEDIDMEAESDLEELSADSTKINRSFPQCSPRLVLPNIGTSWTALKKCLKDNRLPSDIEIDIVREENVVDSMIFGNIKNTPYHPGSTTNIISSEPYVDKAVAGKVTQAGIGSQALPNSQVNKLPRHQRQPDSEKKKVSIVSSASIYKKKNPSTYKQPTDLVFVPGVSKKDDGRRVYNKELACLYCGKLLKHRLKSHLASQHSEEKDVASLLAGSKMDQDKGFQLIKNKGNFKHNIKVLEQGEGKLIVVRRSTHSSRDVEYLPCIHCLGFFRVEDLWRHCGKCPFSTEEEKDVNARSSLLAKSRVLLAGGLSKKITLIEPSRVTDLTSSKTYEKR